MVIKWRKITKIEDKVKEIEEKPEKIRINKIKAAENLKADMELNKEKFNNIDWIEYKKYIIPIILNLKVNAKILVWLLREAFNISLNIIISSIPIILKIKFIDELKHVNYWHNFLIKNLLKRNIYKKYGLDDYEIHKKVVYYFKRLKTVVYLLIHSPFSEFIYYYNGNIINYKKILINILIN